MTDAANRTEGGLGLDAPILNFDLYAEADALRREAPWHQGGHCARTLIKHPDLRIVLIVMRAGARLHEHKTDNRISVQTLTGHVQLNLPNGVIDLRAGHLLVLDKGVAHDVVAQEDSTVLLSMTWATPSMTVLGGVQRGDGAAPEGRR